MDQSRPRRLTRSDDRVFGGVAAGLADYFDVDPTIVRVGWVLAVVLGLPLAVLGYLVLWMVMPAADGAAQPATALEGAPSEEGQRRDNSALLLGIVLVVVGAIFLLPDFNFLPWFGWRLIHLTWPILLIAGGVLLLIRSRSNG